MNVTHFLFVTITVISGEHYNGNKAHNNNMLCIVHFIVFDMYRHHSNSSTVTDEPTTCNRYEHTTHDMQPLRMNQQHATVTNIRHTTCNRYG